MRKRATALGALVALSLTALSMYSSAQQDDEIYAWDTPEQGFFELEMLNAFVLDSDAPYERFSGSESRSGLQQHFVEVGYGLTDRWTVSVYTDAELPPEGKFRYSGMRAASTYRFFDRYQRIVELGLHVEVLVPRPSSGDDEELETRLILQRDLGDVRVIANPGFALPLSGEGAREGLEFSAGAGAYYRRFWRVQPAVEYFGNFGPVAAPLVGGEQRHVIYAGARVFIVPGLSWLLTAGAGLNTKSDSFLARGILTYEFGTVRPADQMR